MPARATLPAELPGSERVLRLERVHETRLSDARGTCKGGDPLAELLGKPIHSFACECADPHYVIPEGQINLFESFRHFGGTIDVHLVHDDHRRDTTRLAHNQETVDQVPPRLRPGSGHHDE